VLRGCHSYSVILSLSIVLMKLTNNVAAHDLNLSPCLRFCLLDLRVLGTSFLELTHTFFFFLVKGSDAVHRLSNIAPVFSCSV
jgi:hypothetical protein